MKSLLEEKIQNGPLLSVFLVAKTQTHTTHTLSTPAVAEYLPASQLVQTVEPAIYVHTLSHTTKGGAR